MKRTDTKDPLHYTIVDDAGVAVDLTGSTVKFAMGTRSGTLIVDANATVDADPTTGKVSYQFVDVDVIYAGNFIGEFHVTFSDGKKKVYPSHGYIGIDIEKNVDGNQTLLEENIAIQVSAIEQYKTDITNTVNGLLATVTALQSTVTALQNRIDNAYVEGLGHQVTLTADANSFDIGIPTYVDGKDLLLISKDGQLMTKGTEYTISGTTATIVGAGTWTTGTVFDIIVAKNKI